MKELEKAIKELTKQYERAKKLEFVRNKIAYAFYQTWRIFDERE